MGNRIAIVEDQKVLRYCFYKLFTFFCLSLVILAACQVPLLWAQNELSEADQAQKIQTWLAKLSHPVQLIRGSQSYRQLPLALDLQQTNAVIVDGEPDTQAGMRFSEEKWRDQAVLTEALVNDFIDSLDSARRYHHSYTTITKIDFTEPTIWLVTLIEWAFHTGEPVTPFTRQFIFVGSTIEEKAVYLYTSNPRVLMPTSEVYYQQLRHTDSLPLTGNWPEFGSVALKVADDMESNPEIAIYSDDLFFSSGDVDESAYTIQALGIGDGLLMLPTSADDTSNWWQDDWLLSELDHRVFQQSPSYQAFNHAVKNIGDRVAGELGLLDGVARSYQQRYGEQGVMKGVGGDLAKVGTGAVVAWALAPATLDLVAAGSYRVMAVVRLPVSLAGTRAVVGTSTKFVVLGVAILYIGDRLYYVATAEDAEETGFRMMNTVHDTGMYVLGGRLGRQFQNAIPLDRLSQVLARSSSPALPTTLQPRAMNADEFGAAWGPTPMPTWPTTNVRSGWSSGPSGGSGGGTATLSAPRLQVPTRAAATAAAPTAQTSTAASTQVQSASRIDASSLTAVAKPLASASIATLDAQENTEPTVAPDQMHQLYEELKQQFPALAAIPFAHWKALGMPSSEIGILQIAYMVDIDDNDSWLTYNERAAGNHRVEPLVNVSGQRLNFRQITLPTSSSNDGKIHRYPLNLNEEDGNTVQIQTMVGRKFVAIGNQVFAPTVFTGSGKIIGIAIDVHPDGTRTLAIGIETDSRQLYILKPSQIRVE